MGCFRGNARILHRQSIPPPFATTNLSKMDPAAPGLPERHDLQLKSRAAVHDHNRAMTSAGSAVLGDRQLYTSASSSNAPGSTQLPIVDAPKERHV
jgi:hypothetical protein